MNEVPIILFAYARPGHLSRTLDALRQNRVPLIYAFSDGPKGDRDRDAVEDVRRILRGIDWCDTELCERASNFGLGKSILHGVSQVLEKEEIILVFEDDLVCVPGTYRYLCTALNHYRHDSRVMSVTAWTHPRVTPRGVNDKPYFDGRAECWVWGTWARAWEGMDQDARTLMLQCTRKRIDAYRYGADLPAMAEIELQQNIWAVRFLYHHVLQGGLCLRPPWTMVEHIGFDEEATNARAAGPWTRESLKPCPPIPSAWPDSVESPECPRLWQRVYGGAPSFPGFVRLMLRKGRRVLKRAKDFFLGRTGIA